MTRRYWYTSDGLGRYRLSKFEGGRLGQVTVRGAEPDIPYDGVWLDGERSPDTFVLIDGEVIYHSPDKKLSRWSYYKHELRGGGHALP